jgi:two-component system response regulator MprA
MDRRPILVVDDDDDVRNMLCAVLSAEGYPVVGAADGIEALSRMRRNPPALAVVDMMMPRMDGEQLIRAMSQDAALVRVPVAIMSGQTTPATAVTAIARVSARLIKPFELDELLTVVHRFADPPERRSHPRPAMGGT